LVEGDKDTIMKFYEDVKKEKPKLAENPVVNEIQFDVEEPVPKAMRSSQALILNQVGKGVDYLEDISNKLGKMDGKLDGMNGKLDSMNGKLDSMNGKLDSMDNKLDSIDKKMDTLPEKIAKALKDILKSEIRITP
ncbi:MAG: hypothetical protein HY929_01045, partial [Euryarchaeota archaeon]|nr:hypothetical protein [Euryarchaeota archaeon]